MIRGFQLITLLFLLVISSARAQKQYLGTVTVFSEDGENFTLYVDEDKQNDIPSTKVLADNVYELQVLLRIVFEDKTILPLKKDEKRIGKNCTYVIEKKTNGERILRRENCLDLFTDTSTVNTSSQKDSNSKQIDKKQNPAVQITATLVGSEIKLSDGRSFIIEKIRSDGARTRITLTAPFGATGMIEYDGDHERYLAQIPLIHESRNTANKNSYFTLTIDEGGAEKTWKVRLKITNGFDLRIHD